MYEINISLNGKHFFATAERSLYSYFDLKRVLPVLQQKFPPEEGYEITVAKISHISQDLTEEELSEILTK